MRKPIQPTRSKRLKEKIDISLSIYGLINYANTLLTSNITNLFIHVFQVSIPKGLQQVEVCGVFTETDIDRETPTTNNIAVHNKLNNVYSTNPRAIEYISPFYLRVNVKDVPCPVDVRSWGQLRINAAVTYTNYPEKSFVKKSC